ncbi:MULTISPECIES: hypothetical protein [Halorussus]|uniref:hypothetical protein n=1 Tax=Halorussus TaxID=1070314 RepID=UPI00209EF137|nr:hypothetical protein [Halorussus vallis]USZ75259.1 hypothetical protein NGM07_17730 [Halorussus vallis]
MTLHGADEPRNGDATDRTPSERDGRNGAVGHLQRALDADERDEKRYHIREALRLLRLGKR